LAAVVRNRYWRAADAQVALDEWVRSGLELEKFARRHGLDRRRLVRWQARLEQSEAPLRFHPVELCLKHESSPAEKPESDDGGVSLVLRGGRRVAVRPGFDEELLARLVGVLESWPC
jgi:hypothetical protein